MPSIWPVEIANAVLVGERAKRLRQPEIHRFAVLLEALSPTQDTLTVAGLVGNVLPLARKHGLSAYDATYLELAIRHDVPLATLDARLRKAAPQAGVVIFRPDE